MIAIAAMMAGCAGDGPQLRGVEETWTHNDVPADVSGQSAVKNVVCNERAIVDVSLSPDYEQGSVSVRVKDGGAYTVGFVEVKRAGDAPVHEELVGSSGTWTIEVRRSVEMDSPFTVMFQC